MSGETVSVLVELPAAIHRLVQPLVEQEGWNVVVVKALLTYHFDVATGWSSKAGGEADD